MAYADLAIINLASWFINRVVRLLLQADLSILQILHRF